MRTLVPGYPAVLDALAGAGVGARAPTICSAARRGCSPGRARGARPVRRSTRRISIARPGNPYPGPDGHGLAGQRLPLRRPRSRGGRDRPRASSTASCRTSCTRMTGRRDWRRPICTTPAATPARHGDDRAQSRLPGPVSRRRCSTHLGCRARAYSIEGVEYYGAIGFLKAGLRARRPHHHGLADLRGRDPHERRHGTRRLLRARGADVLSGILNGIDKRSGTRRRTRISRRLRRRRGSSARGANKAALQKRLGLDPDPGSAAARRDQPADLAEGHRPAARGAAGDCRARRATRPARLRRTRAGARLRRGRRGHPGRVGVQ